MLLITGITGHSGKYLLQELIKNKYEGTIRCIIRETTNTSMLDNCGLSIEKIIGDLSDQEFVDRAMIGVDTVMHIASIFYSVNIIKAAVKNDVKRAILVHTTGIYSKYKSASEDYKNIEKKVEKIIEESNSPIGLLYLRPTMIFGSINDKNMIVFVKMVDRFRLFPIIAHGKNLLQPVNARDLGRAYYQVLSKTDIIRGDYVLSGEKPTTMLDMFNLISKYLGKKTTFISVPLSFGVFMARCLKICTLGKVDYVEKVQRMGEDRNFPYDSAARDFGYNPMHFEEGIKLEVEQYIEKFKG